MIKRTQLPKGIQIIIWYDKNYIPYFVIGSNYKLLFYCKNEPGKETEQ